MHFTLDVEEGLLATDFFQEHKRSNAKNRDSGSDGVEGHGGERGL